MPGRYPYNSEITVLKAIAAAGDFNDFAKTSAVELTRLNGQKYIINADDARQDVSKDLPVYPGDNIFVDRRVF
jgi:protein involved in polysaccharide export with SLBB domain